MGGQWLCHGVTLLGVGVVAAGWEVFCFLKTGKGIILERAQPLFRYFVNGH